MNKNMTNDTARPLVSLLVANFNNAQFIEETLLSAINQTYSNIEIIVVDDASTDNSVAVIEQFVQAHKTFDIQLYRNYTNHGCGRVKRKCIDIVRGDYFAFLDPEDTIIPTAVEELLTVHLENPQYSIVYSTHYLCNEKLEPQSVSTWSGEISEGQSHLTSTKGHIAHFVLCKKRDYDKTLGIHPEYIVAEDQDLFLKMEEIAPVFFVNKPLYYYRKHDHNISWNENHRYRNLYWYHLAENSAYTRRKKNKTVAANYTRVQVDRKNLSYYLQMAKFYRRQKKLFIMLKHYGISIRYIYTLLIN